MVSLLRQPTSVLSSEPSVQSSSPSHAHVIGIQRPVLLQWKSMFGHTRVSEMRTDKSFWILQGSKSKVSTKECN